MGSKIGLLVSDCALAWRSYFRGNVASQNAARIIAQFMAACRGAAKERDEFDENADDGEGKPQNSPDHKLALQR
eukprot:8811269-Pyramimonas_sp.AAC.1